VKHWSLIVSSCVGKVASWSFPWFIQRIINRLYVAVFSIDLGDFHPAETYPTLNHLFTRELRKSRRIARGCDEIVSPCDGRIMACGDVDENMVFKIKGDCYSIQSLCGQNPMQGTWSFVNVYLAPKDYHRYHAPFSCSVTSVQKIKGFLHPVHGIAMRWIRRIYQKNARVVLEGVDCREKPFLMVMIGALNVGGIRLKHDSKKMPWVLNMGDEIGYFEMGSSIVLLMQDTEIRVKAGESVRFGEAIATFRSF
jgi:phosphatidylserine decarboxylase